MDFGGDMPVFLSGVAQSMPGRPSVSYSTTAGSAFGGSMAPRSPIEIRKDFPESWIFDSLNFDSG
jgi:hypothetical protein